MKKRRTLYSLFLSSVMILIVIIIGCGKNDTQQLGAEIPTDIEITKLATILKNPADYNNKKIVMKGIISGQCPAYCEFNYKEGTEKAVIYPQGFQFPKLETGNPVTVFALVTAGEENIVFSALGVQVEKGKKS